MQGGETEARGTRKALGWETGGDGVPGELLAHPRPPPEPRADATAGTGGEKGPRAALGTAGAKWPLRGDGLVLKHPKILPK